MKKVKHILPRVPGRPKHFIPLRYWIRGKITMPLANKIIGSSKRHIIRVVVDGVTYDAEYHRQPYWYELYPRVTIRGILKKRKIWHVMFWDKGVEPGLGGIEMLGARKHIFEGTHKNVALEIEKELRWVASRWATIVCGDKE